MATSFAATFADHAKVLHKDDFQEVKNKKKDKPPVAKRLVIGDSVHDVGFKGIANKKLGDREEHSASVVLSWCTL